MCAGACVMPGVHGWSGGELWKPAAMQNSVHVDGRSWTSDQSRGIAGKPGGGCKQISWRGWFDSLPGSASASAGTIQSGLLIRFPPCK